MKKIVIVKTKAIVKVEVSRDTLGAQGREVCYLWPTRGGIAFAEVEVAQTENGPVTRLGAVQHSRNAKILHGQYIWPDAVTTDQFATEEEEEEFRFVNAPAEGWPEPVPSAADRWRVEEGEGEFTDRQRRSVYPEINNAQRECAHCFMKWTEPWGGERNTCGICKRVICPERVCRQGHCRPCLWTQEGIEGCI